MVYHALRKINFPKQLTTDRLDVLFEDSNVRWYLANSFVKAIIIVE